MSAERLKSPDKVFRHISERYEIVNPFSKSLCFHFCDDSNQHHLSADSNDAKLYLTLWSKAPACRFPLISFLMHYFRTWCDAEIRIGRKIGWIVYFRPRDWNSNVSIFVVLTVFRLSLITWCVNYMSSAGEDNNFPLILKLSVIAQVRCIALSHRYQPENKSSGSLEYCDNPKS